MRISDWSSDVCSSDLHRKSPKGACLNYRARIGGADHGRHQGADRPREATAWNESSNRGSCRADLYSWCRQQSRLSVYLSGGRDDLQWDRSEEHTSELQSLMRISYAVFCLKKTQT